MRYVLFLDDGGVISDNNVRAPQWQPLVGEYLSPILGGRPEDWAEANWAFTKAVFEPAAWQSRLQATPDFESYERAYLLDWLNVMCDEMRIPRLPEDESIELARRAGAWIIPQVRADFPGAADAIRLLHSRGYQLNTASGESSSDLEGYLGAIGVRECFDRLYGPDLINIMKAGSDYYRRMLADAGVAPDMALIVDDSPLVIRYAAEVGAHTVLVGNHEAPDVPGFLGAIGSLAELPALLEPLEQEPLEQAGSVDSA